MCIRDRVAVVQDVRWGRAFEAFGDETALVSELGAAYVRGLQEDDGRPPTADGRQTEGSGQRSAVGGLSIPTAVLATPKHYIGDGATLWGTSRMEMLDVKFSICLLYTSADYAD